MPKEQKPDINTFLAFTIIGVEVIFLFMAPQMFDLCPPAFFTFIIGHFILNCIFNFDSYVAENITGPIPDMNNIKDLAVWRIWFSGATIILVIVSIIYVLFANPTAFIILILVEAVEDYIKSHINTKKDSSQNS